MLPENNWLNPAQLALLRAASLDGDEALEAWQEWLRRQNIQTVDPGSFAILPKLFRNLRRLGVDHPLIPRLRGIYKYTWSRNQAARRDLKHAIQLMDRAGIQAIVLKGVPLLLYYYRDFGARPMSDIDLLVAPEQLEAAADVLRKAGWKAERPFPPPPLRPYLHGVPFGHPKFRHVDLHWRPFTEDCPSEADTKFRSRVIECDVDGVSVRMPDTTDLLILTCFHGRKSDPQAVCRWLMDAQLLVRDASPAIEWTELMARARDYGLTLPVRESLLYLHQTFPSIVPTEGLQIMESTPVSEEDRLHTKWMVRGTEAKHRSAAERMQEHWYRYTRVNEQQGKSRGSLDFLRYLSLFYQHHWSLDNGWEIPLAGLRHIGKLRQMTR